MHITDAVFDLYNKNVHLSADGSLEFKNISYNSRVNLIRLL